MRVKLFSSRTYEEVYLNRSNKGKHELCFETSALSIENAESCKGYEAVSVFTNDDLSEPVLQKLKKAGVRYISIRATGYDHVDLKYASFSGLAIANVPEYSPYSVAEQAIMLILALNRKVVIADKQVKQYNFTLEPLIGFDLHKKNVGIIGLGRIGSMVANILRGFGCNIFAYDKIQDNDFAKKNNITYCTIEEIYKNSDIISLHVPLNESTKYIIDEKSIASMKEGVMLINTSRGGLINTEAVLKGILNGKIGFLGMDVYEKEKGLFFYDHSNKVLRDETLLKLMSMKNVLITPHQGFLTSTALQDIADTTLYNINCWEAGQNSRFELTPKYNSIPANSLQYPIN
jgi:D-lactate dehydrogenase